MATNPAGAAPAYGDISSAPGRRDQVQVIKTLAGETSAGITAATTVEEATDAIFAIALADRVITDDTFGRATRVEAA